MVMNSGIYRIDLGNGHFYIGSSVNLTKREKRHRSELKCLVHPNKKMQNCWNKYGVFEFAVLARCDKSELLQKEQALIDLHFSDQKCVNLAPIAGNCSGVTHNEEVRKRNSEAHKASPKVAEQIRRLHSKPRTAEHSRNNGLAHRGLIPSAEHREKLSAARKGQVQSAEARANMVAAWVHRRERLAEKRLSK